MRAAEGGKKVIQGVLIGDIDGRHVEVHLVAIGVEKVVLAHGSVKQVAGGDARRVLVIVLRSRRGNADQRRRVLRGRAGLESRIGGGLTPLHVIPAWNC